MATMVLTAVGSAVGGPIGAAVGSLVGQYLDREVLFRPGRREGARLADLRLQASSYGVPIPLVFGTMRVAGSVVWATDLIERRQDGRAGKGSPTVSQYSYAASFAVLVSGRPILAIGRVWADGKLLRGAAGDLKAAGAMRVHPGGEDQPPDPLIASAEGAEAPAHRGCAYVVFEALALADFGNRIPSLTFEVVADPGPVTAGAVARALAPEVAGALDLALDGYAAEGGAGEAVAALAAAAGGWVAAAGRGLRLGGDGPATATIADAGMAATGAAAPGGRAVAAAASVPRVVSVAHFDPARDWQSGSQRAVRPGAGRREQRVALPAALAPAAAKAVAATLLARASSARVRRTVAPGLAGWAVVPGAVVTVAGEDGRWRVERVAIERMAAAVTLVPLAPGAVPAAAAGGRPVTASDRPAGHTLLHVAELPPPPGEMPAARPRLSVLAAGSGAGWRGAALLLSLDEGASWEPAGATAAPATVGTVAAVEAAAIEVVLALPDAVLDDADAAALDRGANLALVGDELVQFGTATPLGERRWRLGALRRGRQGTGSPAATLAAGDRFALVERGAVRALDLPADRVGRTVRVMAAGVDDGDAAPVATVAVTGVSTVPPPPAALRVAVTPDGVLIGWQADAPGDGRYRVTADPGDAATWEATVAGDTAVIPHGWVAGRALAVAVRRLGPLAASGPARIDVPAS